jgi:hypothetical protein
MTDVLEKSVTANDQEVYRQTRGAYFLAVPHAPYAGQVLLPPEPPAWWSPSRDFALRATLFAEDMWAAAVAKAITAQAALGWTVADSADSQQRIKRQQDQYLYANGGQGWVVFLQMYLQDILCTDNGGAFEIVRASSAAGSRMLGRVHLDSGRVRRTGDAEIPAIYVDLKGYEHEMRAHQISLYADMPSAQASAFGVGNCAAGRVYRTIYKLASMERYVVEKVTGRRIQTIDIVNGISAQQLEDGLSSADASNRAKNFQQYMGSVIIPSIAKDATASGYRIDLAGLPDGFNAKEERDNGYVKYANALGVSVTQIQPLSGQGLGNAGQSQVLDDQAETAGALIAWRKWWEQNENTWLTPTTTTFAWTVNDLREQKAEAEVQKLRADTRSVMLASGEISPDMSRQIALDAGDIPPELLVDQTPGGTVTDDTKVLPASEVLAFPPPVAAPASVQAVKADDDPTPAPLRRLLKQIRRAVEAMTDTLEAGEITPDQWRDSMAETISTAYPRAYKAGAAAEPDAAATKRLADQVAAQLTYLDGFTVEIKEGEAWQAGWNSRAEMYAEGIKVPYWQGATKVLPLPAMPAEGTTCLTRCKCLWDVQQLDGDGNYDAYWRISASESCQTCVQRAAEWGPLKVRNGRLV